MYINAPIFIKIRAHNTPRMQKPNKTVAVHL